MSDSNSNLRIEVFTSPTRPIGDDGVRTFSPITSTLILGTRDAVLVDAQFLKEDVRALGDMIEATGRRLASIFVTHGHGDHYFGAGALLERFPGADCVATPEVAAYIQDHRDQDDRIWSGLFGARIAQPTALPRAMEGHTISMEGHDLRAIPVEQGDITPTALLHVAEIATVVAGDVVYNDIHQMMAFSGPAEWARWVASIDEIRALKPDRVIAGHQKRDADDRDVRRILDGSQDYIRHFAEAAATAGRVEELVATMRAKYPDRGNLTTLMASANAALKRKVG